MCVGFEVRLLRGAGLRCVWICVTGRGIAKIALPRFFYVVGNIPLRDPVGAANEVGTISQPGILSGHPDSGGFWEMNYARN